MVELPDETQIIAAMENAGFIFEQKVAAAVEGRGYATRVGSTYADADEEKVREIDVVGVKEFPGFQKTTIKHHSS